MLLSLGLLFALAGPAIGSTYDCGPNYASFKVLACANGVCTVDYTNPGQRPHRTRMYQLRNAFTLRRAPARHAARVVSTRPNVRPQMPAAQGGGAIVLGKYECYQLSMGELESVAMVNFTLHPGGRFTDIDGHPGTYTVSGNWITLHGTGLNGQRLRYVQGVPHSHHPPNFTYVRNGEDRESCDGQG